MNEETTLPAVAAVLKKGAIFAANCWGHSFDEAVLLNQKQDWMTYVDQALSEFDQAPMPKPKKATPKIKTAEKLKTIGGTYGLKLLETEIITVEIVTKFSIEFAAMDSTFLDHVEQNTRSQVIAHALMLCDDIDIISFVNLKFEKS